MIKNIVFDIGGLILDDSDEVLVKFLKKDEEEIKNLNKIVYGKRFRECFLGNLTQEEYMKELIEKFPEQKTDIEKLLLPKYQQDVLPLKKETLELMYKLKEENYKIYFLSNLTEVTYFYLKEDLKILDNFDGGIFSCKDHMIKPHEEIYELLIKRYELKREETIFFDDKIRNIEVANSLGIKSIQFKSINDIVKAIEED